MYQHFVRSAVLTKCQDIATGMSDLYATRVLANKSSEYSPVKYSKGLIQMAIKTIKVPFFSNAKDSEGKPSNQDPKAPFSKKSSKVK